MKGNHPKRRKDKYNPYSIFELDGKYYIEFADGQKKEHCMEISRELYKAFDRFELDDLKHLNIIDRHIEQSEIYEVTLHKRSGHCQYRSLRHQDNLYPEESIHHGLS